MIILISLPYGCSGKKEPEKTLFVKFSDIKESKIEISFKKIK